jgi:Skp family chaperone for outer membrane proteins
MADATAAAQLRVKRLETLKTAVDEYIQKERTRLESEEKSLQAILDGRTGGKGIQKEAQAAASKVAGNDLYFFLSGQET